MSEGRRESDEDAVESDGTADWQEPLTSWLKRLSEVRLLTAVLAIAFVALLARLVWLGGRSAHWDEARVAYWAQYYADTGSLAYHWEEHGPFVQIAARWLFDAFGTSDFTARLPVALVGGLLPAAAYLYREHLDRAEVVALALVLSFNSVLLYYGRFMRSDVLVAAFMFTALGMLVRLSDTRRLRYLYGAALFVALGFASKENAIVYVLTWGGATGLLGVHALARADTSGVRGRVRAVVRQGWTGLWETLRPLRHVAGAIVLFLGAIVALFAPRGNGLEGRYAPPGGADTLGLWEALRTPTKIPKLVDTTLRSTVDGFEEWFSQSEETTFSEYLDFVAGYAEFLAEYAPILIAFAAVGFGVEWYRRTDARPIVLFLSYCGAASFVGYPLGSHIQGDWAWISTHIVVALALPAAVGLAWLFSRGVEGVHDAEIRPVAVVAVVLAIAAVAVGVVVVSDVYQQPQDRDNGLAQFAQPASDLGPLESQLRTSASPDRTEVVFYYGETGEAFEGGDSLVRLSGVNASARWNVRPVCTSWADSQPLNWYLAATGADGTCERNAADLRERIDANPPPIIITSPQDTTVPRDRLGESYTEQSYEIRLWANEINVFVHEDLVEN
ncbi:flippase activity-associated protein Agl23 [Halovenus marina]|uniref:flippase activity-associated protein Agl23 n=1 Tax=Halovenus marina TaxID=3396621 RepID=UPI003F55EEC3